MTAQGRSSHLWEMGVITAIVMVMTKVSADSAPGTGDKYIVVLTHFNLRQPYEVDVIYRYFCYCYYYYSHFPEKITEVQRGPVTCPKCTESVPNQ